MPRAGTEKGGDSSARLAPVSRCGASQTSSQRLKRGIVSDESGSQLVEFALTSTVLFMVIFGIIDCCRALYVYHYVAAAAREGTRYAAVRGATWSSLPCLTVGTYSCTATATSVSSYLSSTMPPGANVANLTVTTTWPGTTAVGTDCSSTDVNNAPGCMVNVKVTYAFNFVLPFLPRQAYVLSSTSKIAITQ